MSIPPTSNERLCARLRAAVQTLRRTPMPLADLIPMLQSAADALSDETPAQYPTPFIRAAEDLFNSLCGSIPEWVERNEDVCSPVRAQLHAAIAQSQVKTAADETTENPVAWCVEASHDGSLSPPTKLRMDAATHQESMRQVHPGITWTLVPLYRRAVKTAADETNDDAAFAQFAEYIAREMPEGTVIGDPAWWAPRLWRFARYAKATSRQGKCPSGTTSELGTKPSGGPSESPALPEAILNGDIVPPSVLDQAEALPGQ